MTVKPSAIAPGPSGAGPLAVPTIFRFRLGDTIM